MTPTHANKKGTRYRYYVSHDLITRRRTTDVQTGRRVPAGEFEALVEQRIITFLTDGAALHAALEPLAIAAARRHGMIIEAARLAEQWPSSTPSVRRALLQQMVARIAIGPDSIQIAVGSGLLVRLLSVGAGLPNPDPDAEPGTPIPLDIRIQLRRAGKEMRLLVDGAADRNPSPDRSLLRVIGQAHRFREMVLSGNGASIGSLAKDAGIDPSHFTRVLKLSFLSPALTHAILEGRQLAQLTAKQLTRKAGQLAANWSNQAEQFGLR